MEVADLVVEQQNDQDVDVGRNGHGDAMEAPVHLPRHNDVNKVAREEGNPHEQEWRAWVVGGDGMVPDTLSVRAGFPSRTRAKERMSSLGFGMGERVGRGEWNGQGERSWGGLGCKTGEGGRLGYFWIHKT